MSDVPEVRAEFTSVKIIAQCGNEEIVYDLPSVENMLVDVKYEEPEIRSMYPRIVKAPKVLSFTVSMKPLMVEGRLYTITITTHAIKVE